MSKFDVCAFTESGNASPAYFNVSRKVDGIEHGDFVVTVRGSGEQSGQVITIPQEQMRYLADELYYQFHNGAGG